MKKYIICCLGILALALAFAVQAGEEAEKPEETPAKADDGAEIVKLVEKALEAAKAKDWDKVIENCQNAVEKAQKLQMGSLVDLFPEPPEGWTASKAESDSGSIVGGGGILSGITATRTYTKKEGEDEIAVETQIIGNAQIIQMTKAILAMEENAPMLKMMGVEIFTKDGFKCLKRIDPEDPEGEVSIIGFGDKVMLRASCYSGHSADVKTIFDLFELKKVLK